MLHLMHPYIPKLGPWALLISFALFLSLLVFLVRTDDARLTAEYCANVHSGTWPDFYQKYEAMCEAGKPK